MATDPISGKELAPEFETKAKRDEYITLQNRPEYPLGRECLLCGDRLWKREFYVHMDEHLDDMLEVKVFAAVGADIVFDQERFNELID